MAEDSFYDYALKKVISKEEFKTLSDIASEAAMEMDYGIEPARLLCYLILETVNDHKMNRVLDNLFLLDLD